MSNDTGKSDVTPTESKTTSTVGNFSHGSREIPATFASSMEADRPAKARCQTAGVHVAGKSDSSIVPKKPANNGSPTVPAESAEGRGLTKGNDPPTPFDRTQHRISRSRGLWSVRERDNTSASFTQGKSRMR